MQKQKQTTIQTESAPAPPPPKMRVRVTVEMDNDGLGFMRCGTAILDGKVGYDLTDYERGRFWDCKAIANCGPHADKRVSSYQSDVSDAVDFLLAQKDGRAD